MRFCILIILYGPKKHNVIDYWLSQLKYLRNLQAVFFCNLCVFYDGKLRIYVRERFA